MIDYNYVTSGTGAASTIQGITKSPPSGASVPEGSGCLSKFGLNAVMKTDTSMKRLSFLREREVFIQSYVCI